MPAKKKKKRKKYTYRPIKVEKLAAKELIENEIQNGESELEKDFEVNSVDLDILKKAAEISGMTMQEVIHECVVGRLGYILRMKKKLLKEQGKVIGKGKNIPFSENGTGPVKTLKEEAHVVEAHEEVVTKEPEKPVSVKQAEETKVKTPLAKKKIKPLVAILIIVAVVAIALLVGYLIINNTIADVLQGLSDEELKDTIILKYLDF